MLCLNNILIFAQSLNEHDMFIKREDLSKPVQTLITDADSLTDYILSNIPILKHSKLSVAKLTDNTIKLSAPLYENRNHYGSAFGGSIATIGIVAGWAILTYKIKKENIPTTLVIKSSHTEYKLPVQNDFYAEVIIEQNEWNNFKSKISEKGKAGISVTSKIISNGNICSEQQSIYVGIQPK